MATITQGDFSVFGFFETREAGHWGEGSSSRNSTPTMLLNPAVGPTFAVPGKSFGLTGGSFDFNHWDLAEARQLADIRPDYHMVKNYKLLGRFDTLLIKDADFFAYYRPWYDAVGTLKNHGRERPNTDATAYGKNFYPVGVAPIPTLQDEFFKNDLREYYGQLNFTDNFSARIGKQQVIWSEADALSGTEVTNPVDARWHGVYGAESAEDTRTNIRMVKLNYILPDFLKTANNEIEGFWIPGDFQGAGIRAQADPRNPYVIPLALGGGCQFCALATPDAVFPVNINQNGQILNVSEAPNLDPKGMIFLPIGPKLTKSGATCIKGPGCFQTGQFWDFFAKNLSRNPSNSIENSEFGGRYSTLLPIGNGLQTSFIYLYEFRDARTSACTTCPTSAVGVGPGFTPTALVASMGPTGGFLIPKFFLHGPPRAGVPKAGTFETISTTDFRRNHFFGLTGTYYDKDLTDIVYRYDLLYQPDSAVGVPGITSTKGTQWTELTRWILAADRPTYIPWISKQHTVLTGQVTETWYPDRPRGAFSAAPGSQSKVRELSTLLDVGAVDWLLNGQLTTTNVFVWDADNNVGELSSTNVFRYSRNVLFGLNSQWFLGRSGRYTDPYLLSRQQRFNELEFTLTYEI
jgi:hypothetical protein